MGLGQDQKQHPDVHSGGVSRGRLRRRRFDPQSHTQWRIVKISNRPPNLSAKQSELTVHTKKTVRKGKNPSTKEKDIRNC